MKTISDLNSIKLTLHRSAWTSRAALAALIFMVALPRLATAQDETTDDVFDYQDDEYYEDEFGGEFDDEGYFQDDGAFYDEDEFYDEDTYYEDDAFYEDEFYDEEGFDEVFDDEFLDDFDAEPDDEGLELADDQAGEVELQELELKEVKEPRVLRGYTAKLSVVSPWLVGSVLQTWNSYLDVRFTLDIPRKTSLGALDINYAIEAATFSFEDYLGRGDFKGVALLVMMRIPLGPLRMTAGGGLFGGTTFTGGMVFGASYTLPWFQYIDITAESRFTFVQKPTVTGSSYWMDVGGTFGYLF